MGSGQTSAETPLWDLSFQTRTRGQRIVAMIQSVNIIVLLIGVLLSITMSARACKDQGTSQGKPTAHEYRENKLNPVSPLSPLKNGSKEQIIAYYTKWPATVKAELIAIEGVNVLCLSVDTGSGKQIVSAFIYTKSGDKWSLLYQRDADAKCIDIKFSVKGRESIQILGAVVSTKNHHYKVIYKVLHTVCVALKKTEL